METAKAHLTSLAETAEKLGWMRKARVMAAKPDAFSKLPAGPKAVVMVDYMTYLDDDENVKALRMPLGDMNEAVLMHIEEHALTPQVVLSSTDLSDQSSRAST